MGLDYEYIFRNLQFQDTFSIRAYTHMEKVFESYTFRLQGRNSLRDIYKNNIAEAMLFLYCVPGRTASTLFDFYSQFCRRKIVVWSPTRLFCMLTKSCSVVRILHASDADHLLRRTKQKPFSGFVCFVRRVGFEPT